MKPYFGFYNCTFNKLFSEMGTPYDNVTLRVRDFENCNALQSTILENSYVGVAGTQYINSSILGRDVTISIEILPVVGQSIVTNNILQYVMLFFAHGQKIRVYSNCNSRNDENAFLEGYVTDIEIPRYGKTQRDTLILNISLHCELPYWKIEYIRNMEISTIVTEDEETICFTYEDTEQNAGDIMSWFKGYFSISANTFADKANFVLRYGAGHYGANGDNYINLFSEKTNTSRITIEFNCNPNNPYLKINSSYVFNRSFLDNPILWSMPQGSIIKCVSLSEATGQHDFNYSIGHDVLFL